MCLFINIFIVCLFFGFSVTAQTTTITTTTVTINNNSKDAIGFPESEENPNLKNKENRRPVFLPSRCPINELYYPGDQKDDWICDCRPAYIYHPRTDACWLAYQRGPCPQGEYLVLPPNSVLPVCVKNPCNEDYLVLWNGKCERLGTTTPCNFMYPNADAVLWINATSLIVDCVVLNVESRFFNAEFRFQDSEIETTTCPPGCRRSIDGKCVPNKEQ